MLRNQDVEVNIEVEEQKIFISLSRDVFHIAGTQSSFINIKLFQKLYIFYQLSKDFLWLYTFQYISSPSRTLNMAFCENQLF